MNPTGSQRAWMSAGYICPTSEAIAAVVSAVETAIGTPLTEVALASGPSSPLPAAATADVMIVRYPRLADPKFSSDVFAATSEVHCHCWLWLIVILSQLPQLRVLGVSSVLQGGSTLDAARSVSQQAWHYLLPLRCLYHCASATVPTMPLPLFPLCLSILPLPPLCPLHGAHSR